MNKVFTEDPRTGETLKRCSKCGIYKGLGEYNKNNSQKSGLNPSCRKCSSKPRKYANRNDMFWKRFWSKVEKVDNCLEWRGMIHGGMPVCDWRRQPNASVRRIVYRLACGELPDDMLVITTCSRKLCVKQSHLKAVTKSEMQVKMNNSKAVGDRNGSRLYPDRRPHPRGEGNPQAKLNEESVREIREAIADGQSSRNDLAHQYGVSPELIGMIIRRKIWTHI